MGRALFSGSLGNVCAMADLKMNRLLDTIDEWIDDNAMGSEVGAVERFDSDPRVSADSPSVSTSI